jgi:hypothetical protein
VILKKMGTKFDIYTKKLGMALEVIFGITFD